MVKELFQAFAWYIRHIYHEFIFIVVVIMCFHMENNVTDIFVHSQNGLAKYLTKRITYLIDHYQRIAVNIMLASYGLTHRKLNSNSSNYNQNGAPPLQ